MSILNVDPERAKKPIEETYNQPRGDSYAKGPCVLADVQEADDEGGDGRGRNELASMAIETKIDALLGCNPPSPAVITMVGKAQLQYAMLY